MVRRRLGRYSGKCAGREARIEAHHISVRPLHPVCVWTVQCSAALLC
jgi:hypothetical protein